MSWIPACAGMTCTGIKNKHTMIKLNDEQQAMLDGRRGMAKQMGMRLLLDMAATAGATAPAAAASSS